MLDGQFKHARDLNIQTLLKYDVDRLLAPFRKEAGLPAKASLYPNWEGLDDELVPIKDKPLTFTAPGLKMINPIKVVLEPFYRIHDARYMMYWMLMTNTQSRSYLDSLAVLEKE